MAALAAACTPPTNPPVDSGTIASQVPLSGTPNFSGPVDPVTGFGTTINAIAQVGNVMVAGGNFTTVNGASRANLAAWTGTGGSTAFALPAVTTNNTVFAIEPDASRVGFYTAGKFTNASGVATNVAYYNVAQGRVSPNFKVAVDGTIQTMQLVGTHLLLGGYFSHVNGVLRFGLASVNAKTGALEDYLNIHLSGHHNWRGTGTAEAPVGAQSMAVSPDGSTLMVIGNFNQVFDTVNPSPGYLRNQIVKIRLWTTVPSVDPGWNTQTFAPRCDYVHFDQTVEQLAYSPDGSFFVVVDSGGYPGGLVPCDSASRFNSSSGGPNVQPVWTQFTGKDSLYSVAVTSAAIYLGGHERWLNNPAGNDNANAGAVPRPGIAALDPANGQPLAWNPGRNPRGHGTTAIYATKNGVWFGSDTNCIGPGVGLSCTGPNTYVRQELAFFPYAGGTLPAGNVVGAGLRIDRAGSFTNPSDNSLSSAGFNPVNGAGGPPTAINNQGINWGQMRGAFMLNGRIYYGRMTGASTGSFFYRTFSGGTFGAETLVDPYNDPAWATVATGTGGPTSTYRGVPPTFYSQIPSVTSMFYANRSIYYTLANDSHLYRRAFSPGTQASSVSGQDTGGVISQIQQVVPTGNLVNFSVAGGMWVAGGKLWIASSHSGGLYAANWNGLTITSNAFRDTAAAGVWAGRAVFITQ